MKKLFITTIILFASLNAAIFQTVEKDKASFVKKNQNKYFCSNCAMNLAYYYKTNHVHKNHQYCSIHCLYEATKGNIPEDAKVVDTKTLKFIQAKTAFYVIGSKKPATMSIKSKYAFKNKQDAQTFVKNNGGEIVNFKTAYEIAKNDFINDKKMIQKKREKKVYKMGKKNYQSKCTKIDVTSFKKIDNLKSSLKDKCKTKKEKELQSILVYLWDIEKLNKPMQKIESINIPHDAKCPICGMFVKKHSKWAAKVVKNKKAFYFDGVKDMLKFIFKEGKNKFEEMYVTDYFSTKKINAKDAYFVIGSDVYGPMGKELIAFETDEKAYNFKNEHFGKKVLKLNEMTPEILIYLK